MSHRFAVFLPDTTKYSARIKARTHLLLWILAIHKESTPKPFSMTGMYYIFNRVFYSPGNFFRDPRLQIALIQEAGNRIEWINDTPHRVENPEKKDYYCSWATPHERIFTVQCINKEKFNYFVKYLLLYVRCSSSIIAMCSFLTKPKNTGEGGHWLRYMLILYIT